MIPVTVLDYASLWRADHREIIGDYLAALKRNVVHWQDNSRFVNGSGTTAQYHIDGQLVRKSYVIVIPDDVLNFHNPYGYLTVKVKKDGDVLHIVE